MSLRVVGYSEGRRIVEDEGPGQARIAGWGGALVTARPPVKVYLPAAKATDVPKSFAIHPENRIGRSHHPLQVGPPKPLCGALMPQVGEACARRVGHRDSHRSAPVMATARELRRTWTRGLGS